MDYFEKLDYIRGRKGESKNAERIISEIFYLDSLSKYDAGADTELIETALDFIIKAVDKDGVITKETMLKAEEILMPLAKTAKKYKELFISHAHIDMNWMWGYNETAAVTVETFKTILNLMREYPEYTFAQSQASTYEIIEKFRPDMLPEVRQRIREGRWEVTAAEWVEPDKNMPSGESLVQQILQSKKYLSELLEIPAESLNIDFVPDTFGHNANVPEILQSAGVKYMYHCRGWDVPSIYKFRSPSGAETVNYCEYEWYNGEITPHKFELLPDFCGKYGMDTYLVVYGVGDHGGGPSRRDIERILEYKTWPLTPDIRFGTFREFFEKIAEKESELPVMDHEMNYLFTGCYTTQTRIKTANRIGEARINDAEKLASMSKVLTGAETEKDFFDKPWRNILFNHFHDIIPGSGTVETREFALGRFQEAMGYISTSATKSMNEISDSIDTTTIPFDPAEGTTSAGAGAGFAQGQDGPYRLRGAERGRGRTRAYTLFNTTQYDRDETVEITVWDYNYDVSQCEIKDSEGNILPFRFEERQQGYWGHNYNRLYVKAKIPAFGYETIILSRRKPDSHYTAVPQIYEHNDSFINEEPFVMENEFIKAVIDHRTMTVTSLISKETGEEIISGPSCFFTLVHENPVYGMTAWRVGPNMSLQNLNETADVRMSGIDYTAVYQKIVYRLTFGSSWTEVEIVLNKGVKYLEFKVKCDWNELPVHGQFIPQLRFSVPVSYANNGKVLTDIPFGSLERDAVSMDIPCQTYLMPLGDTSSKAAVLSDTKYGYRFDRGEASVTLIRSSYDPDPYPDRGIHNMRLAVAAADRSGISEVSDCFNHPVTFVSTLCHSGKLPLSASAFNVGGSLRVSAVKPSENGRGIAFRVFNEGDSPEPLTVSVKGKTVSTSVVNALEEPLQGVEPMVSAKGTMTVVAGMA